MLETELPKCDIYLHEWLTSEFWNEKRFLKNFYPEGHKELEFGQILDLVEYAKENNFIDKLRSSGLRPTKQRIKICKLLFERNGTFHFTINDLAKTIEEKLVESIFLKRSEHLISPERF